MAQAIARLHNCVINERLMEMGVAQQEGQRRETRQGGFSCLPSVPEDEHGNPIRLDALVTGAFEGHSELRLRMVERVKRLRLVRPESNRLNNAN